MPPTVPIFYVFIVSFHSPCHFIHFTIFQFLNALTTYVLQCELTIDVALVRYIFFILKFTTIFLVRRGWFYRLRYIYVHMFVRNKHASLFLFFTPNVFHVISRPRVSISRKKTLKRTFTIGKSDKDKKISVLVSNKA